MSNNLPIGIFDSGVGGLTVVKEILKFLPNENLIYLGDTARVPYGTRDTETVNKFSDELVRFMLKSQVKSIVVACNTISAISLSNILKSAGEIPVIDVIVPTIEYALRNKDVNTIGIIGTQATINSKVYENKIKNIDKDVKVFTKACPLFVPLAEEGFSETLEALQISKKYLSYFDDKNLDLLILGCTHYPILKGAIEKSLRRRIKIIDSAFPTAEKLKKVLSEKKLLNTENKNPKLEFYVTDNPLRSLEIANMLFEGKFPGKIEKIILA